MKRYIKLLLTLCAVLLLALSANAQDRSKNENRQNGSGPVVIIVKSAAKVAWVATKVVVKDIAKPVAKAILLKAAPKLTLFVLKSTPIVAKHVLPRVVRLALL